MKKIDNRKSLRTRISIIYFLIATINISLFTFIIFENQIDLISENTKYKAVKLIDNTTASLKKMILEIDSKKIFFDLSTEEKIDKINSIIKPLIKEYIILNDNGSILYKSSNNVKLPMDYIQNSMTAITNKEFTGKESYNIILEKTSQIHFYIPLDDYSLENSILFINILMHDIQTRLKDLYLMSILMIIIVSTIHIAFSIILFKLFINPIIKISNATQNFANGKYKTRIKIKRKDEIGMLGNGFNFMAETIEDKIRMLNKDVQVIKKAKDKIEEMAVTDELTQLYNRRYLYDHLEIEMNRAKRYDEYLGIILIDIDFFKKINDTHGHIAGDIILKVVAKKIKKNTRNVDIVARFGGEEIIIIEPRTNSEGTFITAERIRKAIESTNIEIESGKKVSVTVSVGISNFNKEMLINDKINVETLIDTADKALYKAKKNGRNRTEIYNKIKEE